MGRSRIFLTNWVMVVGPSMSWTSNVVAWRLRRKNFKLPLRKLKQHWSKRRTRFLGLNLSLDRSVKRLTAVSKRRRKSLITLGKQEFLITVFGPKVFTFHPISIF